MKVTSEIAAIRQQVREWRAAGKTVAFVPTMGNLHKGHISLVTESLKHADHVVASIFVNPMQFAAHEDLGTYPKTLAADLEQLSAAGTELVFTPTSEQMYPNGAENHTKVTVPEDAIGLCGESSSRPGFFTGVATIVLKLFNIVQPDIACFGRKDYQQLIIIKTMVDELALPIRIIGVDTYREQSGLAMSSRNNYLSKGERAQAAEIKRVLDASIARIQAGETHKAVLDDAMESMAKAGFNTDYIIIRNANNMQPVTPNDGELVILVAAFLGTTRLIDNQYFTV
ncbi:pantoate--beta-alanine ligase [Shewanella sp. OPT22]|nr:pantoate--beta-alanine ligase [Shewanella sp. OPT22]